MQRIFKSVLLFSVLCLAGQSVSADPYVDTVKSFQSANQSAEFFSHAYGYAVFPTIGKGGIGIGGAHGEGLVYEKGKLIGSTTLSQITIGFQLGAQSKRIIIVIMTDKALEQFRGSDGWEVGVDGSVALVTLGAGGSIDTTNLADPVVAQLPSSLRLPQAPPVRRSIAGPRKALRLHKGLQQNRPVSIALLPRPRQLPGNHRQQFTGQTANANPGQYQKSCIVDHTAEVAVTLRAAPANPFIPWSALPGRCPKAEKTDKALTGIGEVAQLRPRQWLVAQIMVTVDVFVPQRTAGALHQLKAQTRQLVHRRRQQRLGRMLLEVHGRELRRGREPRTALICRTCASDRRTGRRRRVRRHRVAQPNRPIYRGSPECPRSHAGV